MARFLNRLRGRGINSGSLGSLGRVSEVVGSAADSSIGRLSSALMINYCDKLNAHATEKYNRLIIKNEQYTTEIKEYVKEQLEAYISDIIQKNKKSECLKEFNKIEETIRGFLHKYERETTEQMLGENREDVNDVNDDNDYKNIEELCDINLNYSKLVKNIISQIDNLYRRSTQFNIIYDQLASFNSNKLAELDFYYELTCTMIRTYDFNKMLIHVGTINKKYSNELKLWSNIQKILLYRSIIKNSILNKVVDINSYPIKRDEYDDFIILLKLLTTKLKNQDEIKKITEFLKN